ncbi:12236_t:CDS:2 [Funneliformis geosporum]|uniref:7371_t:CDS:1 n=1 Tax=Funneliformis geosporum TaxID=1117311 RepID=A0A9W4WTG4_9GLOM|nr:7371_t:CDS:2 [Funneliformis geosporum]CAI2162437.1 12236_t:CDS:2 [Funneliformis geosporum]
MSRAIRSVFQRPSIINHTTLQTRILRNNRYYTNNALNSQTEKLSKGEKSLFDKLHSKLKPTRLNVEDISGGCGSMYAIEISSESFKGLSVIKQHRMVNEILQDDIKKMHGIRLKTSAD